ncbi:hydroxymethylglutaryl-CoA lyase, mitochondrial [Cylas formicarius]|uniref:hydroxymethylglutaryl-CoA lyase, mitochondrial n=1 Tax=Cylas formicarius TaxID=197179 RepID=UPI002958B61E|nr:hydroxymethylglutaryl-CoA lyase, mitochondrial [Cylas formicarius]
MKIIKNILLKNSIYGQFKIIRNKSTVKIVEVGPRDGLQNEPVNIPTDIKIEFINRLSDTGLKSIEATSFVSPKWVPQMGDNEEVFLKINKRNDISYPVLVPNLLGLTSALKVGAKEIAVFASASEGFAKKNTNCSAEEGVNRILPVIKQAKENGLQIRGYVSCVVGCPYDGPVKPSAVAKIAETLLNHGCYEVSLGDTIGVGTKTTIENMIKELLIVAPAKKFALHCHDTYGQALVNIFIGLQYGIDAIDSSVAGLGGCPYAKGASGNVATEDLVYMLEGLGVDTGIDMTKLIQAGRFITDYIKKLPVSKVNNALYPKLYQL